MVIQREWQRVDPKYLDEEEQRFWATIAGRNIRYDERVDFVRKLTEGRATKGCLEQFLTTTAAENPNRRLRLTALKDRVSMTVERADFDDLVTLVTQAPTWWTGCRASGRSCARSARDGWTRRSRSSPAGRGGSRARRAGAGPPRERRLPGGEAAARRARELARAPARGERRLPRQRFAGAAAARRRRAARVR